jgi:SAM-dependent methyltransferase
MDQPGLDAERHRAALRGLERLNLWSGSARILWPSIRRILRARGSAPLRILDLATGAGDVPIALATRAARAGFRVEIEAWDRSPVAVAHARERANCRRAAVCFREADALHTTIPEDVDVVISSLFLHHLADEDAVALLRRMANAARRLLLVNDLRRCRRGFLLAHAATRVLTTSAVVHTDGPRSVEAAFTVAEARALASAARLEEARVVRRWPFRFLLTWEPP